jgi:hypothetical protein
VLALDDSRLIMMASLSSSELAPLLGGPSLCVLRDAFDAGAGGRY